ncbi:MAG: hypothetical protein QF755_00155 [Candidatus Peribacteraceae bacterium]|jgi:hypothetical protein|nr:hypothetical protein [Candidatus Peribacteraceae bacterium]
MTTDFVTEQRTEDIHGLADASASAMFVNLTDNDLNVMLYHMD